MNKYLTLMVLSFLSTTSLLNAGKTTKLTSDSYEEFAVTSTKSKSPAGNSSAALDESDKETMLFLAKIEQDQAKSNLEKAERELKNRIYEEEMADLDSSISCNEKEYQDSLDKIDKLMALRSNKTISKIESWEEMSAKLKSSSSN
jgi:hypothetical protein